MSKRYTHKTLYAMCILPFMWTLIVFPSSFLATVKVSLLLASTFFFCLSYLSSRKRFAFGYAIALAGLLCFFSLQMLRGFIGTGDGIGLPARSVLSISVVVLITAIVTHSLRHRMLSYSSLLTTIWSGTIVYCLLKLFFFAIFWVGIAEPSEILPILNSLMPGIVTQIFPGETRFIRLATSTDIIVCYFVCLAIILGRPDSFLSSWKWNFAIVVGIISSVQTMTRFIWLVLAITVLYKFFSSRRNFGVALLLLFLSLFAVPFLWTNYYSDLEVYSVRSFDLHSLNVKFQQSSYLLDHIATSPLFGFGAGSYIHGYVRSTEYPFQYENQWFALTLQYGLLFVAITWGYIVYHLMKSVAIFTIDRLFVVLLFILFLISGFTNPNLTIINSALIYILMGNFDSIFPRVEHKRYVLVKHI